MKFNTKEDLARYTIEYYLKNNKSPSVSEGEVADNLKPKAACFITVYIGDDLRGCLGDIVPYQPLYENIIKNSVNAITVDFRFLPIQVRELPKLKVEVSVLTVPDEYRPKDSGELLKYLEKEKPGLIIEKGGNRALFLPQVWDELPNAKDFLSHLCLKANLPIDSWWEFGISFFVFNLTQ